MKTHLIAATLGFAAIFGVANLASAQTESGSAQPSPKLTTTTKKSTASKKATTTKKATATKKSTTTKKATTMETEADKKTEEKPAEAKEKPKVEIATFGGGCFWCMDAVFVRVKGVKLVISGFAGGTVPNPTYEMVCTGMTGHAEVVQIAFDPNIVSFDKLLDVFWKAHDPTTLNEQGPDEGTQYRSVIFYHSEAQRKAALASCKKLMSSRVLSWPVVTQLVPFTTFYPAEQYHQNYFDNNPFAPYCQTTIVPKLEAIGAIKGPAVSRPRKKKPPAAKTGK